MAFINVDSNKNLRDIKYINRDFTNLKSKLIDFSKTYFPNTFNNFSPASPAMVFMDMSSYVGDVLSFYLDNQIQENFVQYARQSNNIYDLAYMFGYKPKVSYAASVDLEFYQLVPSVLSGSTYVPNYDYTLNIPPNTEINTTRDSNAQPFITLDTIDFSVNMPSDPRTEEVYEIDSNGNPVYYLLTKKGKAVSGQTITRNYTIGSPEEFLTLDLDDENIIGILDIFDADGNQYYEVDTLGQETIYKKIRNNNINNPNYDPSDTVPYILKVEKIQRRFVSRFRNEQSLQIQFGSGKSNDIDEDIVPNQNNVGIGLPFGQSRLTTAYSPQNFIFTDTYGIAPSNTTLTVRYLKGGGIQANVPVNFLNSIEKRGVKYNSVRFDVALANFIFKTLTCTNTKAAQGGQDGDTLKEIRQNTLANYGTQQRTVTLEDFLIRSYSLPPEYGQISKIYVEKPTISDMQSSTIDTLALYVLSNNFNNVLTYANNTLKNNIRTYLNQFMMIGDSIEIRDAYIINIGLEFEIATVPQYNSTAVLEKALTKVTKYFLIENWQINQPILIREIYNLIDTVEGVEMVKRIKINNLTGESLGYSNFGYNIDQGTIDNIIYPPQYPSIFEVKYPLNDIKGRVSNF